MTGNAPTFATLLLRIFLPFALAYGAWAEDEGLSAGAAALWHAARSLGVTASEPASLAAASRPATIVRVLAPSAS